MRTTLICILGLAGLLRGHPAYTQTDRSTVRVPVLLAVVDSLPGTGSGFRIVQLAGESARNVVLLSPNASPDALTEAVETLRAVLALRGGGGSAGGGSAMYRAAPGTTDSRSRRVLPWAERVLRDLRMAHPRHVPDVGHVRAVQIWLAPHPRGVARGDP
jgi:hypothetical protein